MIQLWCHITLGEIVGRHLIHRCPSMGTRGVDGVHEQRLRLRVGERHRDYLARKSAIRRSESTGLLELDIGRKKRTIVLGFSPNLLELTLVQLPGATTTI